MGQHWDGTERRIATLRQQAEQQLAAQPPSAGSTAPDQLLHELQVHKIELEMQNEALRQAQLALEESRDRYLDLYEFAPMGYLTLSATGLIEAINLTGTALMGQERRHLLGSRFDLRIATEQRETWRSLFRATLDTDQNLSAELTLVRGDGAPFPARLDARRQIRADTPGILRLAFTDQSELTRTKSALQDSQDRYRLIFEKSNEAIFFGHPNGRIESANPAACALFEQSEEELRQQGRSAVMDVSDPRLAAALEQRRRTGSFHGELRCLRQDGSTFPALVSSSLFRDLHGIEGTSILIRDISEQVEREAQIRHLNRVLRTISACNEILVRARHEDELLRDICRDIVEIGGYQLAWVASPQADAEPLAWFGDADALRGHAALDAKPEHQQVCLVRTALRTRQAQICNQINGGEECRFEELAKLGVAAVLTLPLLNGEQLFGALTIFSATTHHFDAAETKLMAELASDLAFGLAALGTARERDSYLHHFEQTMQSTVTAMARTLEIRDPYTSGHQQRVARLGRAIAEEMSLTSAQVDGLKFGGMIHDIGKIGIPAEILSKPGRLSPIEMALIRQHPETGGLIVADIDFPWPMAQMIAQHHERLDGSGYPAGLKGDDILLEARILAVADVVEAMSSHRPYRASLGVAAALEEIERGSGRHYDAAVATACIKVLRGNGMVLPE